MRYAILFVGLLGCGDHRVLMGDSEGWDSEFHDSEDDGAASSGTEAAFEDPVRGEPHDLSGVVCDEEGAVRTCMPRGWPEDAWPVNLVQACASVRGEGNLEWSACVGQLECTPGERRECDESACRIQADGELRYDVFDCPATDDGFTPLAIDLGDDGIAFERARGPAFDIAADGACFDVDWPVAGDPWLAMDRDGDGSITDGRELFGSGTPAFGGAPYRNGFVALATLDDDGDGAITERDAAFAKLTLWSDLDGDRRGTGRELVPLAAVGIAGLPLAHERVRSCDDRGNCVVERAVVETSTGRGELVDVHLACQ